MQTASTSRISKLPPKKRLIKLIGRTTFWCMIRISKLLRPWSVKCLGDFLGSAMYYLSSRYRKVALKNLRRVYSSEKADAEIRSMAKDVFRHFARGAVEFFYLLSLTRDQIDSMIDVEHSEHLKSALEEGKGCIIITAHYGNWELLARKLVIQGYKVNVIARDSDDPGMTGITQQIRANGGYRVFDRDQPIIGAFRALKNNEFLGILPDQNDSGGIFVDFFSRPAATAVGPAVLSLKSGAALVPVFATRIKGSSRYVATAYPKIEFTPSGDEQTDIQNLTALINQSIERAIRLNPTQWLWLHDRWKLSPDDSKAEDISSPSSLTGRQLSSPSPLAGEGRGEGNSHEK